MRCSSARFWSRQVSRPWLSHRFWYGAADFSGMEERDWRLDSVLQGGLDTWSGGHSYRLSVQSADGRVPLGQFSYHSEASSSFGLKIDM